MKPHKAIVPGTISRKDDGPLRLMAQPSRVSLHGECLPLGEITPEAHHARSHLRRRSGRRSRTLTSRTENQRAPLPAKGKRKREVSAEDERWNRCEKRERAPVSLARTRAPWAVCRTAALPCKPTPGLGQAREPTEPAAAGMAVPSSWGLSRDAAAKEDRGTGKRARALPPAEELWGHRTCRA
jgi:hypothetical protein